MVIDKTKQNNISSKDIKKYLNDTNLINSLDIFFISLFSVLFKVSKSLWVFFDKLMKIIIKLIKNKINNKNEKR